MIGKRSLCRLLLFVGLPFALFASPRPAAGGDLANAQLLIAGSRLKVTPESQTVPYDTPTIVETQLEGYDTSRGVLPKDMRVLADFTGPEIDGVLVLETVPNQPFRIPRLRLQGEYRLDNIRLMQGDNLLAYAAPRSSAVLVTQILITRVTSRALTLDEIRSYGIVVNDDSFQAFNFTFAFAVDGEVIDYNIPVLYYGPTKEQYVTFGGGGWSSTFARFTPPRMAPFQLEVEEEGTGDNSYGGCESLEGDCREDDVIPVPGVILFPTDISLLHQFFSVVLLAQNGAPAGDPLTIHDLTAKITLPPGLRQAKTDPPTPLGVPVPVRVPGPDGELGTGDDLTFLIAQATGQAEVLVEGLREGTHIVSFDLEGVLRGLPGGQIRRVTGKAKGAVIVRDPTLNVTITHPDTVRTDEEYKMFLTVTNTGNTPANLLTIKLPLDKLSGVEVVGENEKTVTVLPGDAELVEFQLRSKRTGRVTSTAARAPSSITPRFELTVGVGENGIPLSPNSIILPRATESLPDSMLRESLNLIGLGFSLATAPASLLKPELPQVSRPTVDQRVWEISQAGRHVRLGEDLFDSVAQLAAEWSGARDADWEWDRLRRTTKKGGRVGASFGAVFTAEAEETSPEQAFDRFVKTTGYLPVMQAALAEGNGVTLEISSRTGGQRLAGGGLAADRLRELPFADLYQMGEDAQMALLAVPEEGGYRAVLRAGNGGLTDLHLLVPGATGGLRMVRWRNISLSAGGEATVEFRASDTSFSLAVDTQGDGVVDSQASPSSVQTLTRREFKAIAAMQSSDVDPTGHVVEVLFTTDVDPASLIPGEASRFSIPGKISNGGLVEVEQDVLDGAGNWVENPFEGLRNTRIVRVLFNNPLSPYTPQILTVSRVKNPLGEEVEPDPIEVQIPDDAMDGTMVQGTVYGPDGKPVPFAEVELRESDQCLFCEESCRTHKTAVVRANAGGNFLFDYVRQTQCSDIYHLKAIDAPSGHSGTATGRVRFVGQTVRLDVLMLGRGTVRGRVTYEDGSVPAESRVIAESPVFREARAASIDANGNFAVSDVPVGTITLSASDGQGRFVVQTIEVPAAGAVAEHNLVILRQPPTTPTNGEIRGKIFRPNGTTPVAGAHVALYVNGNLIGTRRSGADGSYDFGQVPAGHGEIETFEGETGQSGVQVFFELLPDRVNVVDLVMREERGVVTGFVYRKVNGSNVPLFGAIVWAEGTPFKTVTDAQGKYTLEGVFAGTRNISVADLEKKAKLSQAVTIGAEGQIVEKNFYFQDASSTVSGIAGEVLGFDGSPVFGATVHLAAGDQHWYRTAHSDSTGRFAIPDLGIGSYEVHAFKGTAGGKAVATIRFVGDTPFVTIRFKKGTIRGTVKAESAPGNLIGVTAVVTYRTTAVRLELVGLDTASHNITTDANGNFEIPDALAGPYVLTITNSFYGSRTVRGDIVSHGDVMTHDFVFEANLSGNIRGVVLNHDGVTPVQGAQVLLRHPNFSDYDKTTDAEGKFTFELVPPVGWAFPIDVIYEEGTVFRKSQVWVRYNQRGQDLDVEIVLPKQGSISGRVADSNGELVPGSVVALQENVYPHRTLVTNADADGSFQFNNIFAGTVTLSARAPSLGGLGGKTTVEIKAEGEEVAGVTIFLEPTGKLFGQVKLPPAPPALEGEVVASAEVRLLRHGWLFDTINADAEGRFEFNLLPLGWYEVIAFDPRTGRFGRSGSRYLGANNQELAANVQLEARGTVNGHLYEPGTTLGVPGATIQLGAQSIYGFTTYSSTGADGSFSFLGIPQGRFDLTTREPGGRRRASGKGEIVSEGQTVTVDLFLDRQGTIIGTVLNPIGDPDGAFPNANTLIYQTGQIVGATLSNEYEFPGIILNEWFRMRTEEVGGPHRGEFSGYLREEGPVRMDIRMRPIGAVKVDVFNSFNAPVAAAQLEVINDGFYGFKRLLADTGTDNSALFQDLGEGRVTAYATDPATGLKGSASGVLSTDGEIVQLNLKLESSGTITADVVLADGTTPAVNALVALRIGGRTLTTFTDENGAFTIPAVPMGGFLLVLQENFGPGVREINGALTTNGQVLDLGTVVLDDANPKVVEVSPEPGSVDLPLNTIVVVRFSEPMRTTGHHVNNLIGLQTAAGHYIGYNSVWIDGNTAIRLTPNPPLQNFTTYRVRVLGEYLYDAAGRRMEQGLQFSFTTADVLPPTVIEVNPANNAKQVPLSGQVKLTFNESVNETSLSGGHVQLTDVTTGANLTTTFILDNPGRVATVTPVDGLIDGHEYRITVNGVADKVGNAMTVPVVSRFFTVDTTPPVISSFLPAEGTSYTAGQRMPVSATVTDPAGVGSVALRIGNWLLVDNVAPYAWSVPAPVMASAGNVTMELEVTDTWGNAVEAHRTVQVQPRANAQAPQVDLGCLTRQVVPGVQIEVPFHLVDDEGIESYRLTVNGTTFHEVLLADAADVNTFTTWTVPATASPGGTLALHIEARDFAGNVSSDDWTFDVVAGVHLTGNQTLTGNYAGQTLFLAKGTFIAPGPLEVQSLILPRGVTLKSPAGVPLEVVAEGRVELACGASLDVTGLGYAAGSSSHPFGYAPEGVTPSKNQAAGSHGGRGRKLADAGEVYDSVYLPRQAGGGGAWASSGGQAGAGGGVVRIEADEVVLEGKVLAQGQSICGVPGAGGTVAMVAGTISGTGLIDASGGDRPCVGGLNPGGGGRVSIVTDTWTGFDPSTQVRAWGGYDYEQQRGHAAPGTIYYRQAGDAYGSLLIDAGEVNATTDRVSPATELPVLGSGAVTATEAAGGDLWVSAAAGFPAKWLGVWVRLRSNTADLGVFPVTETDGAGRLRLVGAAAVTGAASYQGEYRFDSVELKNGAGLDARDPLLATDSVFGGDAEFAGHLTGATATVKNASALRPAAGYSELRMSLSGKLTVEATGSLDVTSAGYAGGNASNPVGSAPAGVTGSGAEAGGSHGGRGAVAAAGEVYDSVYLPRQAGGGGGRLNNSNPGGAGGGVVRLDVGELELAGTILAIGQETCGGGPGAGGTVAITAGVVSGAGKIDASGGRRTCVGTMNPGGGGRVSIVTGTWSGFDPVTQVMAWGGRDFGTGKHAAPGTILYKKAGDLYGTLQIDAGETNGVDNVSQTTDLPVLSTGAVTATQAAGDDLWVSAGTGFAAKWLGVWVRLRGAGGADLGAFPVAEIDGAGRLRLTGAAAAAAATAYEGEYRFDRMELKNGAGLQASDPIVGPELVLEGNAQVSGAINAANVRVKSGAIVRPASGGELRITTPGRLTIETNATLDVTGKGYAAGSSGHPSGYAPDGVTGSKNQAGGSHGGRGQKLADGGEVYDSVYVPRQAGGGGAWASSGGNAGAGGGVVRIDAGEVVLDGKILALGEAVCGVPGAGGTISIVTGSMSGTGLADASGGDRPCVGMRNPGGGGRVSIVTGTWDGFDPSTQARAWGGSDYESPRGYAAPGTIYYRKTGDVYGSLLIDAGEFNNADRVSPATELPVLGSGAVTVAEAAGDDLWVSGAAGFPAKWLGVWVRLRGAADDLGAFRVSEIDGTGRLRLAGAAAATAAATYQGEYRFDRLELKNGGGLDAADPLLATDSLVSAGDAEFAGHLTGATATVKSGAALRPVRNDLRMTLSGKLTVEATGSLDVTNAGFAGGNASNPVGSAPAGVTGSGTEAGGSHGGRGAVAAAGEVYDSVYLPREAGGGGGRLNNSNPGGAGGGVVRLDVGELELAGKILAIGQETCGGGTGAGGTVAITAGVVSGTGSIDASGGRRTCVGTMNTGGGGRVSIVTGTWNGFNPATQVTSWGGRDVYTSGQHAAPGTLYYKKAGDLYGTLQIDAGETNGVDNVSLTTDLPVLGTGAVTGTQAAGGDLWVSAGTGFATKWLGVWVRLRGAGGADLGAFPVAEIDGAGRIRLTGAAAVAGAATFQGEYRFDQLDLKNGAGLQAADPIVGPELVLEGNAQVSGVISAANVRVKSGAVVRPASGGELRITTPGRLTIETNAALDVTGKGYAPGSSVHPFGYAPDGVTGSKNQAGGSHGGRGRKLEDAGEVYDSVYVPRLAGGGGAWASGGGQAGAGGGVVRIEAGEVVLDGRILAQGQSICGVPGAGGTIAIVTGIMSGTGLADASGGDRPCVGGLNPGGGGRVSIVTGTWNGFDPLSQVRAWGGYDYEQQRGHGAPGTIYYRQTGDAYGSLLIDAGEVNATTDRVSPATELPVLGSGAVTGAAAAGDDLWVSAASGFAAKWLGAWVRLRSATADLGVFPVAEIDGAGRLRLTGAAAAADVASYQGEYRFDRVELENGAGLDAKDPLLATDSVFSAGDAELTANLTGATATVKSGAALRPALGGDGLRFSLTGKLTVEANASIDASGTGYAGGVSSHPDGYAPAGVAASTNKAGGSHGGRGGLAGAGEIYDSVYLPTLAGGGGGWQDNSNPAGAGGGVVRIEAGELALAGTIESKGKGACGGGSGAGGTVSITAGLVSGTGLIDVSGPVMTCNAGSTVNSGGGGRVSIVTGAWDGFNPVTQVKAYGGAHIQMTSFLAPGTIFYKRTGDPYGVLLVDAGEHNGVDRVSPATELPVLGTGAVTAAEAAGGDLWVSAGTGFAAKWLGVWVRLRGAGGADLGAFPVAAIDGTGRLRLAGASAATAAATYQGEYRFDRVELKNGAGLDTNDPLLATDSTYEGESELTGVLTGATSTVKADAVLRPARGSEMRISLTGKLTVEANGRIDATGTGYAGGTAAHPDGFAPDGVTASTGKGGGSHGGRGGLAGAGEVYDSVYAPFLSGGGGAIQDNSNLGSAGGGVVRIEVGELALAGAIESKGKATCSGGSGAGGTVSVTAGVVSGSGLIDVSGPVMTCNTGSTVNSGGGGRVSIVTGAWDGFNPVTQVKAYGGAHIQMTSFLAPGTIFYKRTGDPYGVLLIDAGEHNGVDRVSPATELPVLGTGAVTAAEAAGGDLWVSAGTGFAAKWLGVWVRLRSAGGADLGAFPVAAIDGAGRLRLAGASAASGAAAYQGEYRFDRVELKNGAGLDTYDPLLATDSTYEGESELTAVLAGATATVKTGAVLRPVRGSEMRLSLSGKLTVEANGRIDATGTGYPGGTAAHPDGYAPDGVLASTSRGGGSHGGRGGLAGAGEAYGSVYAPSLPGGGGAIQDNSNLGSAGGGVIRIEAGELALAGAIESKGKATCGGGSGAGGTISITAGVVSGSGVIDASGPVMTCNTGSTVNSGGGGRVAVVTGAWNGFNPATQIRAYGGSDIQISNFMAAGTVFTRTASQTYGDLRIDQGRATAPASVGLTVPTSIGKGFVGAVTAEPANATALWIEPQDAAMKFGVGVAGMWVRVNGVDYPVLAQSADRRKLLLGGAAGTVAPGQAFYGVYKFDSVTVAGRASVEFRDILAAPAPSVATGSSMVLFDIEPPLISIIQPAAGTVYDSGQTIQVSVQASDNRGVGSVIFRLGDQSFTDTASPYEWSVTAPVVEAETGMTITVEAVDTTDNRTTATRPIVVRPLPAGSPPAVAITCPTSGILMPPGMAVSLSVAASHEAGIEKVELLLGSTVLATDTQAPYAFTYTVPAGALDGEVVTLKARARAYNGSTAETPLDVRVVQGTVLTADRSVSATDTSLENASVIVAAGTLTVTGPHTFRDLVVLNGAKVTHPETTSSQVYKLELTLQRDLYVGCGSSLDVTGRGYVGNPGSDHNGTGYPNTETEGAGVGVGGSHGGRGGKYDGSGKVYGSFHDPRDTGAAGGYNSGKGRDGGGVIRVTATGNAVIDGSVVASGETGGSGAGGAGGSIRLNAAALRGAGSIQASGSVGAGGAGGGGGGGRVALYAAAIDSGLAGRTLAAGAKTNSADASLWGAAGTVFLKPDAQALGDLILDNAGTASTQYTELITVGRGVVDAVAADGFTDNEADFRHFLGAAEVAFNGDLGTLYPVLNHAHHGTSLTLAVPTPPLSAVVEPGDSYEGVYRFNSVTVRNGARGIALDTVSSGGTTGLDWTTGYTPSVQISSPAAGTSYTAGTNFSVSATLESLLGVKSVTFQFNGQTFVDTASPYSWAVTAPAVTAGTDFVITAQATDLSGNRFGTTRTIHVDPITDPNAPVVTLGACPQDGDVLAAGVAVTIPFTATDDQSIQDYSLVVDGVTLQTVAANQASVSSSFSWTPPANAAPGTSFAVRVQARDFAGGVGFTARTLSVPPAAPLTGNQSLTSARNGQDLYLGAGTFTVQEPLSLASLTLLNGSRVVGLSGQTLDLTVTGNVRVQCGGQLDASHLGYAGGGPTSNSPGSAPAGVAASQIDAGGSHGGVGAPGELVGPPGEVYGSVYEPRLGGGGGSVRNGGQTGGSGGGSLRLTASSLVLYGDIVARGQRRQAGNGQSDSSGAGGSVLITAGTLSGAGRIDASGGDYGLYWWGGSGGGGRVALYVDTLSGFDPATQVKAWGGTLLNGSSPPIRYAGPGTVFVKTAGQTYGRLIVDAGKETSGTERVGPQTPLPTLGTGAVTAFEAQGANALVTAGAAFKPQWVGAWMALEDATGASLGSFRVLSVDAQGKALLKDAASVTDAAAYRGQYRFDRIDLKAGAGLSSADPLIVSGDVVAEPKSRLPADFTAANVTVKSGAAVTVSQGSDLKMTLSGRLTVETGAFLDVTGLGYAGGGPTSDSPGKAPAGVTASQIDSGGSHGGAGSVGELVGPAGEVYGSVYEPRLGGGGGSVRNNGQRGGSGGGTIQLNVAELVLNGEIVARGQRRQTGGGVSDSSGAGGSVLITAGTLSGAGRIDTSGGDYSVWWWGGSGGGGRVALYVDTFSGFDPAAQVKTWGGTLWNGSSVVRYAGPGTVFVKTAGQTYGRLIVDSGKETNGTERLGPQTPLPTLGTGAVTAFEVQGANALVTAGAAFKPQWVGAWMALENSTGASLGSFRVLSVDAQGKALLKDAASVTTAATYRGQYRFDRIDLKGGAGLSSADPLIVSGDVVAEPKSRLPVDFTAANVTVKAGSAVTVAQGGNLKMTLSGRLTVETGASLDVTGLGYAGGGPTADSPGTAPSGVAASQIDSGGSHGGTGSVGELVGPAGEVYGSVYEPRLGGGGGSVRNNGQRGGSGGGTIQLNVTELVLNGEIVARGQRRQTGGGVSDSSGAGGSVLVTAGTVSGAGRIDASGGDYSVWWWGGSGGGGRVALYVDTFLGFDPVTQAKAWGGTLWNGSSVARYAGPGTVFVKTPDQTYGRLIVDSGKETGGAERQGPQTPLPTLGTGTVAAFEVQGSDALVTAAAAFKPQWVGAWMALEDTGGASLGSFRVLSVDAQGKALLKNAATATAATAFRGQYRFDRIDLKAGAGLSSADPLIVNGDVVAEPKSRLPADLTAANLTIKTGPAVTVSKGGSLSVTLSGRLTVETGASLDVTGLGYAGGSAANAPGAAPAGVTVALKDAGGSHGGIGSLGELAGPAGEIYGSVYEPRLGGGGGSMLFSNRVAGGGGGTILLNVAELVLNGDIRARGLQRQPYGHTDSSGAGGSILITAGTLSGPGLIDASGGDYGLYYWGGSGGGGRVALYADTLSGFDPAAQIRARGGVLQNTSLLPATRYAGPGTVYVKLPADTHGKLYVDQGGILAGKAIPNSPLPAIGVGIVGTATADTVTPTALWIEPADPVAKFALGAVGLWVRVDGTDYRVVAQTADRRKLLLAGAAGTVATGSGYRGVYKFDEVFVRGGAKLEFRDTNVVGTFTVDSTSSVIQNVP